MQDVTEYLRNARLQQRYNQSAVADAVGISVRQYSRWESGRTLINPEALLKIIAFLGVPLEAIMSLLNDKEMPIEYRESKINQALDLLVAMRNNPAQLCNWVEYGKQLVERE
jgi:transcriptional regulator with XRE-family HTH domain